MRNLLIDTKFAYILENRFREKVIDFLSDGKPKILESEQEGKLAIVVTDLSLAPLKELGRLYSTISMTVTEIWNANDHNFLIENNLLTEPQIQTSLNKEILNALGG